MTSAFARCPRASTGWHSDYAANGWYSWMSPPSTLRRAMLARGDGTVVCPPAPALRGRGPDVAGARCSAGCTQRASPPGEEPKDEGPVQAFSRYGPNEALRIGIGTRRSHRGLDDLDSLRGEHRVEARAELRVTIVDEKAKRPTLSARSPAKFLAIWVTKALLG